MQVKIIAKVNHITIFIWFFGIQVVDKLLEIKKQRYNIQK